MKKLRFEVHLGWLLFAVSGGCFHSMAPRTADVLDSNEISIGINLTAIGITGQEKDKKNLPALDLRALTHPMTYLGFLLYNSQIDFRYGLWQGQEMGLFAGLQEQGLEYRFGLLRERTGASWSLAGSVSAFWRPFMDKRYPYFRAGIDLSRTYESRTAWVTGLYVSYGPEAVASSIELDCSGGFGTTGCAEYGSPYWLVSRNELRLQGFAGVSFNPRKEQDPGNCSESLSQHWTFGLVPTWTLYATEPTRATCVGCEAHSDFRRLNWGVSLVGGISWGPPVRSACPASP